MWRWRRSFIPTTKDRPISVTKGTGPHPLPHRPEDHAHKWRTNQWRHSSTVNTVTAQTLHSGFGIKNLSYWGWGVFYSSICLSFHRHMPEVCCCSACVWVSDGVRRKCFLRTALWAFHDSTLFWNGFYSIRSVDRIACQHLTQRQRNIAHCKECMFSLTRGIINKLILSPEACDI